MLVFRRSRPKETEEKYLKWDKPKRSMGSLPNLHALSKEDDDKESICRIYIKGKAGVTYCKPGTHLPNCSHSFHRPLKHTRSAGSNPHSCNDKRATFHPFPLEVINCSSISCCKL